MIASVVWSLNLDSLNKETRFSLSMRSVTKACSRGFTFSFEIHVESVLPLVELICSTVTCNESREFSWPCKKEVTGKNERSCPPATVDESVLFPSVPGAELFFLPEQLNSNAALQKSTKGHFFMQQN